MLLLMIQRDASHQMFSGQPFGGMSGRLILLERWKYARRSAACRACSARQCFKIIFVWEEMRHYDAMFSPIHVSLEVDTMSSSRAAFPSILISIFLLLLTACGTAPQTSASNGGGSQSGKTVEVVAAENYWGSIAAQVGGSHVHVTSIVVDPNADPHAYEPTTVNARAIADAQYVIFNGAGYDPWVDKLLQANPAGGRKELNVGNFNGKHEGDNPHMWYNPDYVTAVANKIRDDLKGIDPGD